MDRFDIAVVGSGFAGSLMSMVAKKLGYSVLLLEKGRHPRFVIGESSTPLTNLLLEHLATQYDLARIAPLAKWGTWQSAYPEIACGLKRGFSFFHHKPGEEFRRTPDHRNELLVAASPNDRIADTHWYRPHFDEFLVREAQRIGVEYRDQTSIEEVEFQTKKVLLQTRRNGIPAAIEAKLLIDATGQNSFLQRVLGIPEEELEFMPPTEALYTHFRNVKRFDEIEPASDKPPYPPDDSAVHHVFRGGWIWVLRFNNGITSAGVAATRHLAEELNFVERELAWKRVLDRFPTVRKQFESAEVVAPWIYQKRVAFRLRNISGNRWAMLPSSAGFVDPILSTGFPLALLGIARLALVLKEQRDPGLADFSAYARETKADLAATEQLVGMLYFTFDDPERFKWISFIYFAAMLFTETSCRLGHRSMDAAFLLRNTPFWNGAREIMKGPSQRDSAVDVIGEIPKLIQRYDLGGLLDERRLNWFPADSKRLIQNSGKCGISASKMQQMLKTIGA
jgi:FADH2 O2-dependent halogenase